MIPTKGNQHGVLPPDGLKWQNLSYYPDHRLEAAPDGQGGIYIRQYHDGFGIWTNLHLARHELCSLLPTAAEANGQRDAAELLEKRREAMFSAAMISNSEREEPSYFDDEEELPDE